MTRYVRSFVVGTVCVLAGSALLRAATGSYVGRVASARAAFVSSAIAAGLGPQAAAAGDPTPVVTLAAPVAVAPGTSAPITLGGKFPAGAKLALRGSSFELTGQELVANKFQATVAAKPNAPPSIAYLEVVSKSGKRAGVEAAFVAGRWTIDTQAKNGWKVLLKTDAASAANIRQLPFTAEFYKDGDAKPFQSRPGSFSLESGGNAGATQLSASLQEPTAGQDPACDAVTKRMQEISTSMAKGSMPSEKQMAELEKLTTKYSACAEKMMAAQQEQLKKMQDPAWQKAEQQRRDDFGCQYVAVTFVGDGTATGRVNCGKNVGTLELTGTVQYSAK